LFRRGDYRKKATTPKSLLGSSPDEEASCRSKTKHKRKMCAKEKFVRFGEEITGIKATNPKTVLGSSLGEDFGFRDTFFYNIQQYMTLEMT
jgi:hypothetical protein